MSLILILGGAAAPVLSSPSGVKTGTTTANIAVNTDVDNGTWWWVLSTSASVPTPTQIKAGQMHTGAAAAASGSGAVAPGAATLNDAATGLSSATTYYLHTVQEDAIGNASNVATSAGFTTDAAGDTTPPSLSAATGAATGPGAATAGVTTNEGNGTLYVVTTTSPTKPTATQIRNGQTNTGAPAPFDDSQAVHSTGAKSFAPNTLSPGTTYYNHFTQRDAAGNDSAVVSSAAFTTPAAVDGSLVDTYSQASGGGYFQDLMDFGSADADRLLAHAFAFTTNDDRGITGDTIGGIAASEIHNKKQAGADYAFAGIYAADVPSGTSGLVKLQLSGLSQSGHGCVFALYRILGENTHVQNSKGDTSGSIAVSLDVKVGDFVIAVASFDASAGSVTLSGSGLTEDINTTGGQTRGAIAHKAITQDATLTVTASLDAAYDAGAVALIAFRKTV